MKPQSGGFQRAAGKGQSWLKPGVFLVVAETQQMPSHYGAFSGSRLLFGG